MSNIVRRARSALRHLNPNQNFLDSAQLVVQDGRVTIETYWRNREVQGVWLLCWPVAHKCFFRLKNERLIELDAVVGREKDIYKLSARGLERLRKT